MVVLPTAINQTSTRCNIVKLTKNISYLTLCEIFAKNAILAENKIVGMLHIACVVQFTYAIEQKKGLGHTIFRFISATVFW